MVTAIKILNISCGGKSYKLFSWIVSRQFLAAFFFCLKTQFLGKKMILNLQSLRKHQNSKKR